MQYAALRPRWVSLGWLVALAIAGVSDKGDAAQRPDTVNFVSRITTLKEGGARMDWLDHRIAFDMLGPGDCFAVYVMRSDGSDVRCLTWRPDGTAFAGYYHEGRALASKHVPTKSILVELGPR